MKRNLYDVLGIEDSLKADNKVIKRAYKNLALKYHPDKSLNSNGESLDHEEFLDIKNAYDILIDPLKKLNYDKQNIIDQFANKHESENILNQQQQNNNSNSSNNFVNSNSYHHFYAKHCKNGNFKNCTDILNNIISNSHIADPNTVISQNHQKRCMMMMMNNKMNNIHLNNSSSGVNEGNNGPQAYLHPQNTPMPQYHHPHPHPYHPHPHQHPFNRHHGPHPHPHPHPHQHPYFNNNNVVVGETKDNNDNMGGFDKHKFCQYRKQFYQQQYQEQQQKQQEQVNSTSTTTTTTTTSTTTININTKTPKKGENISLNVPISFEESIDGCDKLIPYSKLDICESCGDIYKGCQACQFQGFRTVSEKVKVQVPIGCVNGYMVVHHGLGNVSQDIQNLETSTINDSYGDLHVQFEVGEHELFKREGNDVIAEIPINFIQAILGARITVPFLYGSMEVDVPPGTQPNQMLKIKNQGFQSMTNHKNRGDYYIKLQVEIPKSVTPEQTNLLIQFNQISFQR